jgi:hypothetical protein
MVKGAYWLRLRRVKEARPRLGWDPQSRATGLRKQAFLFAGLAGLQRLSLQTTPDNIYIYL